MASSLSFAVCFSRRYKRPGGKASSSVGFRPFYLYVFKGGKTHRGTGKAGAIIYPSAEADGKRETDGFLGDFRYEPVAR